MGVLFLINIYRSLVLKRPKAFLVAVADSVADVASLATGSEIGKACLCSTPSWGNPLRSSFTARKQEFVAHSSLEPVVFEGHGFAV